MFEAAVGGFGGAVAGVGVVDVGQGVPGSAFECPAQGHELGQAPRCARGGQCVDVGLHQDLARTRVRRAIGIECDVAIAGEQVEYLVLLTQREEA